MYAKKPNFKIKWDNKARIFRIKLIGDINEPIAREIAKQEIEIVEQVRKNVKKILFAIYDVSESGRPTPGARKILGQAATKLFKENPDVQILYVHKNLYQKVVAKFIHSIGGMSAPLFFSTEKKAEEFIKIQNK